MGAAKYSYPPSQIAALIRDYDRGVPEVVEVVDRVNYAAENGGEAAFVLGLDGIDGGWDCPEGSGWVYVLRLAGQPIIKIGWTGEGNIRSRIQTLQSSSPFDVIHVASFRGDGKVEHYLHSIFASYNMRGEWFRVDEWMEKWIEYAIQSMGGRYTPDLVQTSTLSSIEGRKMGCRRAGLRSRERARERALRKSTEREQICTP